MNWIHFFSLSFLLLSVNAFPIKKLLTASTKALDATLLPVPSPSVGKGFCVRYRKICATSTAPPSTTSFMLTKAESIPVIQKPPSYGGTPPSAGGPPSGTGSCVSCAVKNFNIVNDYRASNGLNQLGWSDHLANLADQWSKEMYDTSVFKHSDFNYWENIIWGYRVYTWDNVAQKFFEDWRGSPGHDNNMRLPTHMCMGVGIYGDGTKLYGTQIFSDDCP